MKYIAKYLEERLHIKGLGEVTTDTYKEDFIPVGEKVLVDGCETGIVVHYIDYIKWLESKPYIASNVK